MKFNPDIKEVKEFSDSNWLPFGVSKVQVGQIVLGGTEEGEKEYIEITVLGDNDEEDTARLWFTSDAAANYSFNTLRQIYVHNAPEDKKDAARDTFDKVMETKEAVELFNEKIVGGECWFTKYYDPSRTYVNQSGDVKRSVNKNVYGYEPKLKPELMPKEDKSDADTESLHSTVDKVFPGAKQDDSAAEGIPESW